MHALAGVLVVALASLAKLACADSDISGIPEVVDGDNAVYVAKKLRLQARISLPPGWLEANRVTVQREMQTHQFLFIVGSPMSG